MELRKYNLEYLTELSNGDEAFKMSMIEYFISNTPTVLSTIDELLDHKNWKEIREVIHRFIPNLNMVGALDFIEDANKIEVYSEKELNLDQVPLLWRKVKENCLELIKQLTQDFTKL